MRTKMIAGGKEMPVASRLRASIVSVLSAGALLAASSAADPRRPNRIEDFLKRGVEDYFTIVDNVDAGNPVGIFEDLLKRDPGNPSYHYGLGLALKSRDDFPGARACFRRSVELGAGFWEPFGELLAACQTEAEIIREREFFEERRRLASNDPLFLQASGVVRFLLSDYEESFRDLTEARRLFRARGDRAGEARCLLHLSDTCIYLNDYPAARRMAEEGEAAARATGRAILEAECLERQSFIAHDLGDIRRAVDLCDRAMGVARRTGNRAFETLCTRTRGVICLEQGRFSEARECLDKSLRDYRRSRNVRLQDVSLYWMTLLHKERGDFAEALDCARRALVLSRAIGFKTAEAFHLTAIADIHRSLGNYDRALEFNAQALRITDRYIGKWSREECLNSIGFIHAEQGVLPRALEYFEKALAYIRKIGHLREEEKCLYNVGCAHLRLGHDEEAGRYLGESLARARATGRKAVEALAWDRLGDLALAQGRLEDARGAYGNAAALGRAIGLPQAVWEACAGLGSVFARQGDLREAIASYKRAVGEIENVRSRFLQTDLSAGFFQSKVPVYERLVGLLYERARASASDEGLAECFEYVERAKARAFLDDLEQAKVGIRALHLSPEMTEELEGVSKRISRIFSAMTGRALDVAGRDALTAELDKAEDEYEFLMGTAAREDPSSLKRLSISPSGAREVRDKTRGSGAVLLEYFVAEDRLYMFAVGPAGLVARRFDVAESRTIFQLVRNYVGLLASRTIDGEDCRFAGQ
ncbi:MAG TPA: tetratricopeptide repeat protein, partial [Acidobacteriota bacterium]|nr:tetratricopeptide repeat protein [Acidobacteriota bacterium]